MDVKETLKRLTNVLGGSGDEFRASAVFAELIRPFADEVETDAYANVTAVKRCGKENARLVMIDAHIDQMAMMAKEVTDDGFVKFIAQGFDPRQLYGADVTLITRAGKELPGIVATFPKELQYEEITDTVPVDELSIDLGLPAEKVKAEVTVGDFIYYANETIELADGTLCGRAFDDRAAVTSVLIAAEKLSAETLGFDVLYSASAREEVGGPGAAIVANRYKPDFAVVLDLAQAKCDAYSEPDAFELGGGAVIGRGDHSSPRLAERLAEVARAKEIPFNFQAIPAQSKTNAGHIQLAATGIETAVLSFPERYSHSPVEIVSIADTEKTAQLLAEFVLSLGPHDFRGDPDAEISGYKGGGLR
ncbi:MAG: M20/M25/M40 family metallo-hydrolase [Clostridiales Family XIII bacterium]|jgi:endoglucanase|nr:M20/M25/M40 family metallo-hydrolase [Clostridiales Family XIII bacterium]